MILSKIKSFFASKATVPAQKQSTVSETVTETDVVSVASAVTEEQQPAQQDFLQLQSAGVVEDVSYLATSKFPVEVGVLIASDSVLLKVLCRNAKSVEQLVEFSSYAFDVTNQRALKHRGVGIKRAMVARLQTITSIDFEDTYLASVQ